MQGPGLAAGGKLSRREISAAVSDWGWRLVLRTLVTQVPAGSLAGAADLAARLTAFPRGAADGRRWPGPRSDRLLLTVQPAGGTTVTGEEVELAHRISAFVRTLGLATAASATAAGTSEPATGAEASAACRALAGAEGAAAEGNEACVGTWEGRDA